MSTLLERIRSVVADHGDRIAHAGSTGFLTYDALWRRAGALAAHLSSLPPGPVMVIGHKEPAMLVGFLGSALAGRAYIPVDISLPAARVERIKTTAQPAAILTIDAIGSLTGDSPPPCETPLPPCRDDDPFYIIFTSGSTGDPKGMIITHECLSAFVDWMLSEHPLRRGQEVVLNQAPFSFDLSVMDLYLSLLTGGTLVSLAKEEIADPRALFAKLRESGVTIWVSTPSFAQMCLVERTFDASMLPGMRRFLFCGEALAHKTAASLKNRFPGADVWNTYGPTEAAVATTSIHVDAKLLDTHDPLPIGYQRPGSRVFIRRPDGSLADDGERGEIIILGPNVSPGYLARPDLTDAAFFSHDGMRGYQTGDRGYAKAGLLFFEGRMDFQVKVRGHRIELGDVESHIRELPGVIDAVVLPVERRGVCESLAAFVIPREQPGDDAFAAAQSLRAALASRLPDYMLPRRIDFLEAFPITPNGKADRRALASLLS